MHTSEMPALLHHPCRRAMEPVVISRSEIYHGEIQSISRFYFRGCAPSRWGGSPSRWRRRARLAGTELSSDLQILRHTPTTGLVRSRRILRGTFFHITSSVSDHLGPTRFKCVRCVGVRLIPQELAEGIFDPVDVGEFRVCDVCWTRLRFRCGCGG